MSDAPPDTSLPPAAPVGQGNYTVDSGDCLSSIAVEQGFFWDSLWNLPENKALREQRKNPNALLPGDQVFVPDLRQRTEKCITGKRHKFRRKGEPTTLRFQMLTGAGDPRANIPYRITLDGKEQTGTTNAQGVVEIAIPGNTHQGTLFFDTRLPEPEEYDLELGRIDPIESLSGIQARLNNLGYDCGDVDGEMSDRLSDVLRSFQQAHNLPVTGELNQATSDKLKALHDSMTSG